MRVRTFIFILPLLIYAHAATATICSPVNPPKRYVGNMAADAQCTDDSIQSAINNTGTCPTTIVITPEHTYTQQALVISGKSVSLVGSSVAACGTISEATGADRLDSTPLTIRGSSGNSVIHIDGTSNVTLDNLVITGGSVSSSDEGGGIYFGGSGSLTLTSTLVQNNGAGHGGGIAVDPNGPTTVTLGSGSVIEHNTAVSGGGGIYVAGQTYLQAIAPSTFIYDNSASDGYGGGLNIIAPAHADIASSGYFGLPVIYSNSAGYGGGIAATAVNVDADAVVRLFSVDADNPVQVSDNSASHTGGGVYVSTFVDTGSSIGTLCASDFRIDGNSAPEGAAIYSDTNASLGNAYGGVINFNNTSNDGARHDCQNPQSEQTLGAVRCAPGILCNELSGNVAQDTTGDPTPGSTLLLQAGSSFLGSRFSATNNTGQHVFRLVTDDNVLFSMDNCVVAQNEVTGELLNASPASSASVVKLDSCTVTGNNIGAPYVALFQPTSGEFDLYNSIINQPGRATVDSTAAALHAQFDLSNDISTLLGSDVISGVPTFVDAAQGDFHLQSTSLGVDFAPQGSTTLDRDGNTRVVDLPNVANTFGSMDLGAYEIQTGCYRSDTIFCDGFDDVQ